MSITIGYANAFNPVQGCDILFGDGTQTFDYQTNQTLWSVGSMGSGWYQIPRGWSVICGTGTTSTGWYDSFSFPSTFQFIGPIQVIVYNYGGVGNPPTFYPVIGVSSKSTSGFTVNCKNPINNSPAGGISFAWFALGY